MKDFDQIALAVIRAKGIESASVQRIVAKDHMPYQKNEGGSGYKYKDAERLEYVVFLRTDKMKDGDPMKGAVNHEARGSDLMAVIAEAFKAVGVEVPKL